MLKKIETLAKARTGLFGILVLALLFGCGDPADDRERVRARYGEPDDITGGGAGPYWYELWYYEDEAIYYEFRRTAPRCGGGHDYYLYRTYYGGAPRIGIPAQQDTIEHMPELEDSNPMGP